MRFLEMLAGPVGTKIARQLREDEWVQETFTIVNKTRGYELWTSNGFFFLGLRRPQEIGLSFWGKVLIWINLRNVKQRNALKIIE